MRAAPISVRKGARIVTGGSRIGNRGYFYPLTVLADVPDDARAMREEPFGPLALLSPVKTLDEAIEKANSLPYVSPPSLHQFGTQRRSAGRRCQGRQFVDQPPDRLVRRNTIRWGQRQRLWPRRWH